MPLSALPTELPMPSPAQDPARPTGWLRRWWPAPLAVDGAERWRMVIGVGLGLLVTALVSRAGHGGLGLSANWPWLAAPLGASAVLVFGLPASPLAQPWAVVGGNTVAALVGVACTSLPLDAALAGPLAAALAMAAMLALRCLHPPGGAVALLAVLIGASHWHFALLPVALNSALLVAVGVAYNRATGRRYPHLLQAGSAPAAAAAPQRFTEADIDLVLKRYNQLSHLPRDDLRQLMEQAELQAHERTLTTLRCADVMSANPVVVAATTPLQDAWALLRQHRIKALPVIDSTRRVVGIVTQADFMRLADLEHHPGADAPLVAGRAGAAAPVAPWQNVGQIMTRKVRVASAARSLGELVPIFSDTGHHHIPVIDEGGALVGIVTQTDLVRSLMRVPGV
ncbi:MAG: HPP family protein [Ideonella sp.]|nr:HPP family protein [Ideonella sp.]